MITQPIKAIPAHHFRSTYHTIRSDIHCLFSGNLLNDPEQKKRIVIEIATSIALVLVTGTVMWCWWVRPLQKQLKVTTDEPFQNIAPINDSNGNKSSLHHIFRHGTETFLKTIVNTATYDDLSKLDDDGNSVLHYAASRNLPEIIGALIAKKLNINTQNSKEYTPLHFAAFTNQKETLNSLLKNEANPTITNMDGETPRQVTTDKTIQTTLELAEQKWAEKQIST